MPPQVGGGTPPRPGRGSRPRDGSRSRSLSHTRGDAGPGPSRPHTRSQRGPSPRHVHPSQLPASLAELGRRWAADHSHGHHRAPQRRAAALTWQPRPRRSRCSRPGPVPVLPARRCRCRKHKGGLAAPPRAARDPESARGRWRRPHSTRPASPSGASAESPPVSFLRSFPSSAPRREAEAERALWQLPS